MSPGPGSDKGRDRRQTQRSSGQNQRQEGLGAALRRGLHTHTRAPHTHTRAPRAGVQSHTVQGGLGLEASPQNVPPGPLPGLMLSGPLLAPSPLRESRRKSAQTGVFKFPVSRTPAPGHMVPSAAHGPAGWGQDRVGTHTERPTAGTPLCPAGSIRSAHAGPCTGCRSRRPPACPSRSPAGSRRWDLVQKPAVPSALK